MTNEPPNPSPSQPIPMSRLINWLVSVERDKEGSDSDEQMSEFYSCVQRREFPRLQFFEGRYEIESDDERIAWEYLLSLPGLAQRATADPGPGTRVLHASVPASALDQVTPNLVMLSNKVFVCEPNLEFKHALRFDQDMTYMEMTRVHTTTGDLLALGRWLSAARPLIQRGLVTYLPTVFETSTREMQSKLLRYPVFMPLGVSSLLLRVSAQTPPTVAMPRGISLPVALPYFEGLPTQVLCKVIEDNFDIFERFRNSIQLALSEVEKAAGNEESEKAIERIQKGIIEDGVSTVRAEMKRILAKSLVLAAGGALGIVGVSVSCFVGRPDIAALLGGSGLGLIANEYADYLDEVLKLRQHPMYFLYLLGKAATSRGK